jgi:uncharacterized protein YehS (DUF1456 family)
MKVKFEGELMTAKNNHYTETINRALTLPTLYNVADYLKREARPGWKSCCNPQYKRW